MERASSPPLRHLDQPVERLQHDCNMLGCIEHLRSLGSTSSARKQCWMFVWLAALGETRPVSMKRPPP